MVFTVQLRNEAYKNSAKIIKKIYGETKGGAVASSLPECATDCTLNALHRIVLNYKLCLPCCVLSNSRLSLVVQRQGKGVCSLNQSFKSQCINHSDFSQNSYLKLGQTPSDKVFLERPLCLVPSTLSVWNIWLHQHHLYGRHVQTISIYSSKSPNSLVLIFPAWIKNPRKVLQSEK